MAYRVTTPLEVIEADTIGDLSDKLATGYLRDMCHDRFSLIECLDGELDFALHEIIKYAHMACRLEYDIARATLFVNRRMALDHLSEMFEKAEELGQPVECGAYEYSIVPDTTKVRVTMEFDVDLPGDVALDKGPSEEMQMLLKEKGLPLDMARHIDVEVME